VVPLAAVTEEGTSSVQVAVTSPPLIRPSAKVDRSSGGNGDAEAADGVYAVAAAEEGEIQFGGDTRGIEIGGGFEGGGAAAGVAKVCPASGTHGEVVIDHCRGGEATLGKSGGGILKTDG
jgi:hypothetical protein